MLIGFDDAHASRRFVEVEIDPLALITSDQPAARVFWTAIFVPTAGRMTGIGLVRATRCFRIVAGMCDHARRAQAG